MPRGPRLDAPGAVHHVVVRGIERRALFLTDDDRRTFLERVAGCILDAEARCLAWSLMTNHVHLLVRTGQESLSRLMHRIGTSYAMRFNRRHGRTGYLFQNRFHSSLVDTDAYLLMALRYVLRNPLEAGIVENLQRLEAYSWSAYGVLLGLRPRRFEAVDDVLALFGSDDLERARQRLREIVRLDSDHEVPDRLEALPPRRRSGAEKRIRSRNQAATQRADAARERLVERPATLRELMAAVCDLVGAAPEDLASGRRDGATAAARAAIAYLATRRLGIPGCSLARPLGVSAAGVSRAGVRGASLVRRLQVGSGWEPRD